MAPQPSNNANQRQIPIVCPGHTRPLAELQFLSVPPSEEEPQGRTLLVSACHDRMPMLRDGVTGDWIGTWSGHKGAVWSCKLDATASLAATASGDFSVRVWDAITGSCLLTLQDCQHIVKTCDFSPDSTLLATAGHDGKVRIYDLVQLLLEKKDAAAEPRPCLEIVLPKAAGSSSGNKKPAVLMICKCVWASNSTLLVGCSDGNVRVYKIASAESEPVLTHTLPTDPNSSPEIRDMELRTLVGTEKTVLTVAAGNKVFFFNVTSSSDNTEAEFDFALMKVHELKESKIRFTEEGGASLHPSGRCFVAGGATLWVHVFDYETGAELDCNKGHHGPIRCLRYSPDGSTYASGSEDGTIRLWKTTNTSAAEKTEAKA